MLRIGQLKLPVEHTEEELRQKILKILHIRESELLRYQIHKQSLDARKKPELFYVYAIDAEVEKEQKVLKKADKRQVNAVTPKEYRFVMSGTEEMENRPVVVGSGPAGLFCAYMLAVHGYRPVLIERGAPVEKRMEDVKEFWESGKLSLTSNVQFGEGGAGTFSDGKLNTLIKDPLLRGRKVLEIFVEHGAPAEILYVNKPHIGTDILAEVVKNIRKSILKFGGEVLFYHQLTDIQTDGKTLKSIIVTENLEDMEIHHEFPADILILAPGHSARDTFDMLYRKNLYMEAKAFAVGVRMEHPQTDINRAQYGESHSETLPAAAYKLTAQLENGRGVYSFCMCPGGYVVNASSEEERLAVNGMSYHSRDGKNANSGIIVTVTPEDYGDGHPLSGVEFQRRLEENAYREGGGKIPVQRFEDFRNDRISDGFGTVTPSMKGAYAFGNVRRIFPEYIGDSLVQGIKAFDRKLPGFANDDAVVSGVESRTSSPIRIRRDENLESNIAGIYPCGEGAGYAGGITSAAMDGLKVAEMIAGRYHPFDTTEL